MCKIVLCLPMSRHGEVVIFVREDFFRAPILSHAIFPHSPTEKGKWVFVSFSHLVKQEWFWEDHSGSLKYIPLQYGVREGKDFVPCLRTSEQKSWLGLVRERKRNLHRWLKLPQVARQNVSLHWMSLGGGPCRRNWSAGHLKGTISKRAPF